MNEPNAPEALSLQVNRSKIAGIVLQGRCADNFSSVLLGFWDDRRVVEVF